MEAGDAAFVPQGTIHAFYSAQDENGISEVLMAEIARAHGQEFVGPSL